MGRSRAIIFLSAIQIILIAQFIDYNFNPTIINNSCLTAEAEGPTVGKGKILDCIACHNIPSNNHNEQFIGQYVLLIPMNKIDPNGLNLRLPFDSTEMIFPGKLDNQLMFTSAMFIQSDCADYDCASLQRMDDFALKKMENVVVLAKNLLNKEPSTTFHNSTNIIREIGYQILFQDSAFKSIQIGRLVRKHISSTVLRTRYSTGQSIDDQSGSILLFHQLQTNIYIRISLVLIFILAFKQLYFGMLAHFTDCARVCIMAIVTLAFINSLAAVVSSTLIIYFTLSKVYNLGFLAFLITVTFAALGFLSLQGYIPLIIAVLFEAIYMGCIIWHELKAKNSCLSLNLYVGLLLNLLHATMLNWHFLVFICPLHLTAALLILADEKPRKMKQKYNLINLDQDEDVLTKIDRQLQNR